MSLSIGGLAVAAARVWTAASELRERLVALTEAAEATCVACMKMKTSGSSQAYDFGRARRERATGRSPGSQEHGTVDPLCVLFIEAGFSQSNLQDDRLASSQPPAL